MFTYQFKFKTEERPEIVCLCGSTRFFREYQEANYQQTMKGKIVLSVGFFPHASVEAHGQEIGITEEEKIACDELHKRKIDMADIVYVVCPGGYIGSSTRSEIEYAEKLGKKIWYTTDGKTGYGNWEDVMRLACQKSRS